jgi:hypothetical protein
MSGFRRSTQAEGEGASQPGKSTSTSCCVKLEPHARREVGHAFEQALDVGVLDAVFVDGQARRAVGELARELRRLGAQMQQLLVVEVDDARIHGLSLSAWAALSR